MSPTQTATQTPTQTPASTVGPKPTSGSQGSELTLTGTGAATGLVQATTFVIDGSTAIGVSAPTSAQADELTTLAVSRLDKALGGAAA